MKDETQPRVETPVEFLTCCCCGGELWGRQWWNRDTGFGICPGCYQINGITDKTKYHKSFGHRGIHWDCPEPNKYRIEFGSNTKVLILQNDLTEATGK